MYTKREEKSRLNLTLPTKLYDRLFMDSVRYGISKASIVSLALTNYYRMIDAESEKQTH